MIMAVSANLASGVDRPDEDKSLDETRRAALGALAGLTPSTTMHSPRRRTSRQSPISAAIRTSRSPGVLIALGDKRG
jgi:hypothetical protein